MGCGLFENERCTTSAGSFSASDVAPPARFGIGEPSMPCGWEPQKKVFIGSVGYLDYDDELISDARAFWPHMYKRRSFEHERELRVVLDVAKPRGRRSNELPEEGVDLRVDLKRLIEGIYVAPTSPGWFLRVVQSIVRRYGFSFRVQRSGLSRKPLL